MRACLVLFCLFSMHVSAQVLDSERLNLAEGMAYLEDPAGNLDLAAVRAADGWKINHGDAGNFGFSTSVYWFRVDLQVRRSDLWSIVLHYPLHDDVQAFWLDKQGNLLEQQHTGDLQPFAQRPVFHREFVFSRYLHNGEYVQFYLRLKTEGTMQVPLDIMNKEAFAHYDNAQGFARGVYIGVMVVMVLYNSVIFLMTGMRTYRNYVGFVLSFLLMQMSYDGTGFMYLWPGLPQFNNIAVPVFMSLSQLGFLFFAYFVLSVRGLGKTARHYFHGLNLLWGLLALAVIIAPYHKVVAWLNMGSLIFSLSYFALSLVQGIRGHKFAIVFAVANFLFISGLMLGNLRSLGVVPGNFITLYGYMIGSLAETILFAIALALRILEVQARRKQQDLLAAQVKEDTHRQQVETLSGLVVGIAHELNTPLGIVRTSLDFALEQQHKLAHLSATGQLTKHQFNQHVEESREALDMAGQNLSRMGRIVSTFKRSSVAQMGYKLGTTSLNELGWDVRQLAMHRKIELNLHIENDAQVHTYDKAIVFMLTELMDNTLAHNTDNLQHRVDIHLALRSQHIYLRYADNGQLPVGIELQKIFDPFYTSQRGSGKRMGLGLYQVHNIVTQLFRGRVNVSTGTGLIFEFELPYAN